MKKLVSTTVLSAAFICLIAQQNLQLVSQIDYVSQANDIWGYTAPDGTEYALVGLHSGVSIVSLADPANPVETQLIPGAQSAWRDLKTWGHFAYVTADQPGTKEGILVIDLSTLPGPVQHYNWKPFLADFNDTLFTCHNIYIDESGYAYITGCNVDNGGVVFLDVATTPGSPAYAGKGAPVGAHDAYTRDNLLFSSEILKGQFAVYDVSNKANPALLATQPTPNHFTHNAWLNDAATVLFTTDERANASTAAYDISNLDNIRFLDEFKPPATLGTGVIPHNVHVLDDYLVISHYTDGCVIVDASRPDNLVQVGQYDTNVDFTNGFHGAWGAYPFFPSGLIVVSDIENGLFVLQPDYKRACWLEGKITDKNSGAPVAGTSVRIQSTDPNEAASSLSGTYKTGQPTAGTFDVKFSVKGYFDAVAQAVLVNGEVTILDVQMIPWPSHLISGKVLEKDTGAPIPDALVFLENQDFNYTAKTDANGAFSLPGVLIGDYSVAVGEWGFENIFLEKLTVDGNKDLLFEPGQAYQDNFNVDLGWAVSSNATDGFWERGIPLATEAGGSFFNPPLDSPNDPGKYAYVTGNQGVFVNDDDVDGGATLLASPPMLLKSRYNRPLISYDTWFFEPDGNTPGDDTLVVSLDNGKERIILETVDENVQQWRPSAVFDVGQLMELTDDMRLLFYTSDYNPNFHFLEVGLDNFKVVESWPDEYFTEDEMVKVRAYPNPYHSDLMIDYKVERDFDRLSLLVFSALGQMVREIRLEGAIGTVDLGQDVLVATPYFLSFRVDGKLTAPVKVLKVW